MIPVNTPVLSGNEKKYLAECIDSSWVSSEGPFVGRFESAFADRVNRRHGVSVSSGTAALDVAVAALGIGQGDEVIMPSFTIISCAAAVVRAGAIPVVVDCHSDTWNMDVSQIEARITSRTRAIMVVHIYGLPVDMDPVIALAERYDLSVLEDSAEAIGQTYHGRPCGSFGDISTFSFYANKHVTTGEGGMVVTDDDKLADRCRSLRNLCFQPDRRFVHEELGWNYRFTNVQAAIGLAQLEQLDRTIARKREIGLAYVRLLADCTAIELPVSTMSYSENLFWVFGIVLKDTCEFEAQYVTEQLRKMGIGTRPFFWPIHLQPVFRARGMFCDVVCPVAERLGKRGFYLPSGLGLSDDDVKCVVVTLLEILT